MFKYVYYYIYLQYSSIYLCTLFLNNCDFMFVVTLSVITIYLTVTHKLDISFISTRKT